MINRRQHPPLPLPQQQQQQQQQQIQSTPAQGIYQNLDKIKNSWYHASPKSLYYMCIDTLVRNIELILVKNTQKHASSQKKTKSKTAPLSSSPSSSIQLKYCLADTVGNLPSCVCHSLIKSYAQYYLEQLGRLERAEFFQIGRKIDSQSEKMQIDQQQHQSNTNLITYYDLLMALASRPDRVYLNGIEYHQCIWSSSTLEQRIRTRIQNELLSQTDSIQQLNSNYFRLCSANDENKLILKSVRAQQPAHLEDNQLKSMLKHQSKRLEHLDLCPCLLTNKSVHLINKHLGKHLKQLRLRNCCDWSQKIRGNNEPNEDQMELNENEMDADFDEDDDEDDDDNFEDEYDDGLDLDETDLDDELKIYLESFLNQAHEENEMDDDTGEFDAYLEEYLNRYEKTNELESNFQADEQKKKRRRHHHHHHHHHRHHRHHHRHHIKNNKRNKSERYKRATTKSDEEENEILNADLELFLLSNNLSRNNYAQRNNEHLNRKKKKKDKNKCKLFKLDKEARLCRRTLRNRLNSILNQDTFKSTDYLHTEKSKPKFLSTSPPSAANALEANYSNSAECDREANSLMKWLVQNTINSNASPASFNTSTRPSHFSTSYPISLIEQIKQRAALLAETKLIDKVSISSSNYDETDIGCTQSKKPHDDEYQDELLEEETKNSDYKLSLEDYLYSQSFTSSSSSSSVSSSLYSFADQSIYHTNDLIKAQQTQNHQSTESSVYLSYDEDDLANQTDKVSDAFQSKSNECTKNSPIRSTSSESSCHSSCSSNVSSSSSSTDYSDTDEMKFHQQHQRQPRNSSNGKSYTKQQRLLDKVANLGSSPINVIQSIAAKALKFKLKNSVSFAQLAAQLTDQPNDSFTDRNHITKETKTVKTNPNSSKYNRLLRQYKFFKSSNISNPNKPTTSKAAAVNTTQQMDFSLFASKNSSKRLREFKTNEPSTGKLQQPATNNLFSVFKFWMSNKKDGTSIDLNKPSADEKQSEEQLAAEPKPSSVLQQEKKTKLQMFLLLMDKQKRLKSLNLLTRSLKVETLNLVNLQQLSLRNLGANVIDIKLLNNLFRNLRSLKILDVSNCCTNQMFKASNQTDQSSIGLLDGLVCLRETLTHLIMADLNVDDIQANMKYLLQMKQIRHLDVSNCREKPPVNLYKNASVQLAKLVYHLTNLTHLDISGTNLGGTSIFKELDEIEYIKKKLYEDLVDEYNDYQRVKLDGIKTIKSDVAGLMFLNNGSHKLEFFGCFSCDNSVSSRAHLPAIKVAGEDSEKNLYTSLEVYVNERPLFVLDALNHLFEAYRDELVEEKLLGGHLIMNTMEKNLDNSRIQISGSASLFYVLKYWKEENVQLPPFYLKRLIQTVINGMEEHIDEPAMRRNCVLIMCRLNLPDDVLFVSDRLIKILLKIFDDYIEDRNKNPTNDRQEHFVLRTAMHLLNILACSVHGNDKSLVGSLAIPVAMSLIKTKTRFKEADDILEVTWSFLWNITDETPENCKIFLDNCDGMSAFMECIQFKKTEITRNMMGLLGNVAEVKMLRNRLCKNDYIATFRQLLFYSNDGIEIPYNSAGVLVHIMSDGPDAWLISDCHNHERQEVIEDIETAIDKWDLKSERNINYRSFEPIFRLVKQYDSSICQRWSCWALANLTTVYPEIYCPLFEKENGREILESILANSQINEAVKNFSRIVLRNVDKKMNNME